MFVCFLSAQKGNVVLQYKLNSKPFLRRNSRFQQLRLAYYSFYKSFQCAPSCLSPSELKEHVQISSGCCKAHVLLLSLFRFTVEFLMCQCESLLNSKQIKTLYFRQCSFKESMRTKDSAVSKRLGTARKRCPLMFKRVTFNSFEFASCIKRCFKEVQCVYSLFKFYFSKWNKKFCFSFSKVWVLFV